MDNEFDNDYTDNDFEGSKPDELSYVLGEDIDSDLDVYSDYADEF